MNVPGESIAKVALDRVKSARNAADNVNAYSSGDSDLKQIKGDLDIAAELLALIVPPPADAPA